MSDDRQYKSQQLHVFYPGSIGMALLYFPYPIWPRGAMMGASERIWALVSGFPGERRRGRQLLMLQAHIDDSYDGDANGGNFVLAGYIARADAWAAFSDEWQQELDAEPPLKAFKMRWMANSPKKLARSERFYEIIERHVTAAVSCHIDKAGLVRAVDRINWPPYIKNVHKLKEPYFSAFRFIIVGLAQMQASLRLSEPIDFIFDEHKNKAKVIAEYDRAKLSVTPDVRRFMGATPIFRDDEMTAPLQAADLYAWWVRKWALDGAEDGVKRLRFSWASKVEIPRLHMQFTEKDFVTEFVNAINNPRCLEIALLDDDDVAAQLQALRKRQS